MKDLILDGINFVCKKIGRHKMPAYFH